MSLSLGFLNKSSKHDQIRQIEKVAIYSQIQI